MKEMLNLKNPKIYAEMFLGRMPKNAKRILMYGISDKRTIEIILDSFPKATFVIADREANLRLLRHFYKGNKYVFINITDDEKDLPLFEKKGVIGKMPKFDTAIMNPPFGDNLHLTIFDLIQSQSNKTVCVFPFTWAAKHNINLPKGKWRTTFNGIIDDIIYIDHRKANDIFGTGNAIEDLAIVTTKNKTNFDLIHYGFSNENEYNLYKKINFYDNENCITMSAAKNKNGIYGGTAEMFRTNKPKFYVPIYAWHGGENCYEACIIQVQNKIEKGCSYFRFNNEEEIKNFKNSLKTKFMNWFFHNIIEKGDCKIQNYFFRMKDYSKPWTDSRFRKLFNLNDEEWAIIEGN